MKNTIKKLTLIVVVSLTFLVGCTEFLDKIDDFNIGATNTIFEQSAVIELKDYFGHQEDIVNTDFTIQFSGTDADKLVNEAGEFTITETDGFIQLNVNPNKSVGVQELNFDVTVSGGTYRKATFPITLKNSTSFTQLQMVDEAKMVGTDKTSSTASLTNNMTTASTTVATTATKSINTSSVTIDAGTQFKDAAGALISGSNVTVALTNVDIIGEDTDPNYNEKKVFKDANGNEITDRTPVLLGRTVINMEVGGKQVKQFNKPIAVGITISNTIKNPATGNSVQLGDSFPIYTNEEGSEDWTYHGLGTVSAGATANTFNVNFTTTHLSTYTVYYNDFPSLCIIYKYNFKDLSIPADYEGKFDLVLNKNITYPGYSFPGSNSNYTLFHITIKNGKVIASKPVPDNIFGLISSITLNNHFYDFAQIINSGQETLTKDDLGNGKIIRKTSLSLQQNGKIVKSNLSDIAAISNCEALIDLTTLAVNDPKLKTINIDVAANCNGNTLVPDGFPIYVERADGSFSYEGTLKKGKLKLLNFELNKEYNFKSLYKGKSYFHKWTFDSENFTDKNFKLPDGVCAEIGF